MTQLNAKDITPDDKQELDEALQREVCGANHGILFLLQTFRTFALFYLFIYCYCYCYCSVYPSVLKMEIYLLILSIDFRDYTFSNISLFNAVHSHNVQELLFSSYIKFSIPFLSYIIHFFSSLVDTSCISYR